MAITFRIPAAAAATATVLVSTTLTTSAYAAGGHDSHRPSDTTFAVIGDIPYGAGEIASLPKVMAQINVDPAVSLVAHLGDIKEPCPYGRQQQQPGAVDRSDQSDA